MFCPWPVHEVCQGKCICFITCLSWHLFIKQRPHWGACARGGGADCRRAWLGRVLLGSFSPVRRKGQSSYFPVWVLKVVSNLLHQRLCITSVGANPSIIPAGRASWEGAGEAPGLQVSAQGRSKHPGLSHGLQEGAQLCSLFPLLTTLLPLLS